MRQTFQWILQDQVDGPVADNDLEETKKNPSNQPFQMNHSNWQSVIENNWLETSMVKK